jgi:hypothetical protein
MRPRACWRVTIAAHKIARWEIPVQTLTVPAVSIGHARERAVRVAQRAAGCPPWRPFQRASYRHTKVQAAR